MFRLNLTQLVGIITSQQLKFVCAFNKACNKKREKPSNKGVKSVKLTAKGRYAVMAVADLAAQGTGMTVSLSDISTRQGISLSFLEQLFGKLRRAGVVTSQRGASGGYTLAQSPDKVSLDKIIHAVDEDIKAHGCDPDVKAACNGLSHKCLTHNLWGALERHIENFLADITIDDVVNQRLPIMEAAE